MSPRPQKPAVIDGLTSVRAAQRARTGRDRKPAAPNDRADAAGTSEKPEQPVEAPARFHHTAKPKRFDIRCYHCGYSFPLHGRLRTVPCPKCRGELSAEEVVIEAERTRDIRTIGRIEVAPRGRLTGCTVTANHLILAGNARDATDIVCNTLTIRKGARYEASRIKARSICVDTQAHARFSKRITCRDLEVRGRVTGHVRADHAVCIRQGGLFTGTLHAYSLTIEDGGSLVATLDLRPRGKEQHEEKGTRARTRRAD